MPDERDERIATLEDDCAALRLRLERVSGALERIARGDTSPEALLVAGFALNTYGAKRK
jgi:hypothetical protein